MIQFAHHRVFKSTTVFPVIWIIFCLVCFPLTTLDELNTVSQDLSCEAAAPDGPESASEQKVVVSIPTFVAAHLLGFNPVFEDIPALSLHGIIPCSTPMSLRC